MEEALEAILLQVEDYETYGLRVSRKPVFVGQELDNSHICWPEANLPDWAKLDELDKEEIDGETWYFGEELDGTCAVDIRGFSKYQLLLPE